MAILYLTRIPSYFGVLEREKVPGRLTQVLQTQKPCLGSQTNSCWEVTVSKKRSFSIRKRMWATGTCRRTDPNTEQYKTKFPNMVVVVPVHRHTSSTKNGVEQLFYTFQLVLFGENNSEMWIMKISEVESNSPLTSILSTLLNDRLLNNGVGLPT